MRYIIYILTLAAIATCNYASAQYPHNKDIQQSSQANGRMEIVSFDDQRQVDRMLDDYEQRFRLLDSVVFRAADYYPVEPAVDKDVIAAVNDEHVYAIDDVVEAQIRAMKAKTGLDLQGQAYYRPGRQISYDPDDPLVAYNAKVQAELIWNIFSSSIYKRASKIRELRLQGELRQLEYAKDALDEVLFMQRNLVRDRYYGRMLSVLNIHADNLKLLMNTQLYLLQNGKISSDDLLKLINEQAEIERQLIAIKADSVVTEIPAGTNVMYISVADTSALMDCIRLGNRDLRKLSLRKELLDAQRKNIDYLQTMNIQPFVRYSYYNRPEAHNTYNIDAGLAFRFPLSAETARKRKAIAAEKGVVDYEQRKIGSLIEREVVSVLRDLENYNENIYGEYERMESLKKYLRMRIDSYGNVAGEYSRIDRLQEYNAYLQAWERMLTYAYQRDCKLIELQSYITDEPVSKYLVFQDLR